LPRTSLQQNKSNIFKGAGHYNLAPFLEGHMKVLTLQLGDKTYSTSRITAYFARRAMEINKQALELAKRGNEIKDSQTETVDIAVAAELMDAMTELNESKAWFICQVYGERFGIEDLETRFTTEEIDAEFTRITNAIYGVIEKNG
jgi:hypothetical protein